MRDPWETLKSVMLSWHEGKLMIEHAVSISHDTLHLIVGMLVWLAAAVLSRRPLRSWVPWTWTFVLLTKFTMGVGLLWFVVRREWRELAIAVVPAVVICAVSYVLVPQLWADWVDFLLDSPQVVDEAGSIPIPLWLRMAVAVVVVIWGARTDRRWTVVVAATLALPVLWIAGLATLVGIVPELRRRRQGTPRSDVDDTVIAPAT